MRLRITYYVLYTSYEGGLIMHKYTLIDKNITEYGSECL